MIHRVAAAGFGSDADRYERARPGYPTEAVDEILRFAALERGDRILDVAAGTGKLTRMLRGAPVVALEPVAAMRRHLAAALPDVRVVGGIAEALPFADRSFRLLTAAQAFHWFDAGASWREFARVVTPGGAVALIWNARDRSVDWLDRIWSIVERIEQDAPWQEGGRTPHSVLDGAFDSPRELTYRHEVVSGLDGILDRVGSVSHVAALPERRRRAIVAEIRDTLSTHPDTSGRTEFVVPYRTDVYLFRRT